MRHRSSRRQTVSSYGIVCYRLRIDFEARCIHPEFLVVQRKDSISFAEFSRGKYSCNDMAYVRTLISTMTDDEKQFVATRPFTDLWRRAWGGRVPSSPRCVHEHANAKQTHETLAARCGPGGIEGLVGSVKQCLHEREHGFPKGRRCTGETDLQAATREFHEETGVDPAYIHVHDMRPLEEVFQGSNGILYRHVYYLARLVDLRSSPAATPAPGSCQALEISAVKWAGLADVCAMFEGCSSRLDVARRANANIIRLLNPDPQCVKFQTLTPASTPRTSCSSEEQEYTMVDPPQPDQEQND